MREDVVRFGEQGRLIGILARPLSIDADVPAIVIPNTGVEHRIGPNRLHVHLSRALATAGFPVLRLDLSGMGDSLPAPAGKAADSVSDLRAALDELTRLGVARRFAVFGLCSGGNDAHQLALADDRVEAAGFIDHYAYPTPRFRLHYWAQRLLEMRRWRNFVQRKFVLEKLGGKAAFRPDQLEYFVQPDAKTFAQDLDRLVARRLPLLFLYTGEIVAEYNYREQLTDAFPRLRGYAGLQLHYLPAADHTFTRVHMRAELIRLLLEWAASIRAPR